MHKRVISSKKSVTFRIFGLIYEDRKEKYAGTWIFFIPSVESLRLFDLWDTPSGDITSALTNVLKLMQWRRTPANPIFRWPGDKFNKSPVHICLRYGMVKLDYAELALRGDEKWKWFGRGQGRSFDHTWVFFFSNCNRSPPAFAKKKNSTVRQIFIQRIRSQSIIVQEVDQILVWGL